MRTAWVLLALLSLTTAARAEMPLGRLPDNVIPTAYRLDLDVDPAVPASRPTRRSMPAGRPSTLIYLHGNGLRVERPHHGRGE